MKSKIYCSQFSCPHYGTGSNECTNCSYHIKPDEDQSIDKTLIYGVLSTSRKPVAAKKKIKSRKHR